MRYSTELMDSILTSETAQRIIDYVTPRYGEAYVCLWFFQVIGAALDETNSFPQEYINQVTPQTATWSIEFWEQEYGIEKDNTLTLEQRRVNILNKIRNKRRLNPWNMEQIANGITGKKTKILENTGKNKFTIAVSYDDSLERDIVKNLTDHFKKIKPAHLTFDVTETLTFETVATLTQSFALSVREEMSLDIDTMAYDTLAYITDELGRYLTDEVGNRLIV